MNFREVTPQEADRVLTEKTIQLWRQYREQRLAKEAEAKVLHKTEQEMKSWLIAVFREQEYEGMIINQRMTGLSTREVHSVVDRAVFTDYILKMQDLSLLQFRLSEGAIVEREAAGVELPGLEIVETYDLFDRKA